MIYTVINCDCLQSCFSQIPRSSYLQAHTFLTMHLTVFVNRSTEPFFEDPSVIGLLICWTFRHHCRVFQEQEILAVFSQRPLTELAPGGICEFWPV